MTHEPRPMRKSTVPIYQLGDSLYLNTSGYITEVPDPTGSIAALLDRMDGTRTVRQLHDELHGMYPTVTLREIEAAIAQFDRAGFLEDATHGPEGLLDAYELARWQRNINFLGSFTPMEGNKYELQARIKSARVALLGLGGLGSHLLLDLAALGVQHIRAAEFDKVELSNLNRQILYTDADVGRPKMEVAAERIRAFSPRLRFESFPSRLGSTEDVRKVISGCQYVVCVADRPKMEIIRWVNEACVQEGAALVTGGLDTQRVLYYSMIPGVSGCAECWRRQVQRQDPMSTALLEEKRRLQIGGDNAAVVPLVSLVAGLMLCELVRLITNVAPPVAAGRLIEVRFSTMEMQVAEEWGRQDDCPVCQPVVASVAVGG
jgi:molybdopterin/thiamine biosynthesis adenylyltransferase